jgi:hypothetical protein
MLLLFTSPEKYSYKNPRVFRDFHSTEYRIPILSDSQISHGVHLGGGVVMG